MIKPIISEDMRVRGRCSEDFWWAGSRLHMALVQFLHKVQEVPLTSWRKSLEVDSGLRIVQYFLCQQMGFWSASYRFLHSFLACIYIYLLHCMCVVIVRYSQLFYYLQYYMYYMGGIIDVIICMSIYVFHMHICMQYICLFTHMHKSLL